ncbi:MAG: Peptidyl-tRNA hydrolase [Alphaproteobacteria bacterium MarineAlpha5_Bin11]|nr:aminoacyl-tRNA hydrolase [Pelagibacteraceae bacterium]PPR43948.1 MAG: Peptidyl-tRNA hydrolase [Alphaproteobacteria bacterium MarineAlpha5_Bin11]PPR50473.1 MAG: Peptidyl-tRNA hydrolase [Alphaproteobacteria bacterium MarineAlpha5_Bin10]|tara:strand:+ start:8271 stop:8840 length:570 start_codon:yes stop_codon:yes gene_type:complete
MRILCGLGNPGNNYKLTRHNVGFRLIEQLVKNFSIDEYLSDEEKQVFKGEVEGVKCYLFKPLTYMNLSGIPLIKFLNFYKINREDLIVIHDELDIELGKIKIKFGGGNGGHKGLQSIDQSIGNNYKRLRIGIGHPGSKDLVDKYVLEKFEENEESILNSTFQSILGNLQYLLEGQDDLFLTKTLSGKKE